MLDNVKRCEKMWKVGTVCDILWEGWCAPDVSFWELVRTCRKSMEKTEQRKSLFISCSPKVSYLQVLDAARPSIWRDSSSAWQTAETNTWQDGRSSLCSLSITFSFHHCASFSLTFIDFHSFQFIFHILSLRRTVIILIVSQSLIFNL